MTSTAPVERRPLLRALMLCAGVAVLTAALVLLVVSHQPSASAASAGHLHGSNAGVVHASAAHDDLVADGGAAHTHRSPAGDHDHGTLVACTLLAAATLLALVVLRWRSTPSPAPSAGTTRLRVVAALVATTRRIAPPDLLALGISRT
ncbi:hypothetical protein [Isoptericola haloaureus]|uniref:Uncharacterized protein n=1 Tax=Isoptericola haloaureus TaxID=1542902 RepID=A0ABU7Z2F3_9MICO